MEKENYVTSIRLLPLIDDENQNGMIPIVAWLNLLLAF